MVDPGQPLGIGFAQARPGAPIEHDDDSLNGVVRVIVGPSGAGWRVTFAYDASASGPSSTEYSIAGDIGGAPRDMGVADLPDRVVLR